ncbi:MAG: hypothetical protein ACPG42_03850 [Alphaproteobacteria bacterium]
MDETLPVTQENQDGVVETVETELESDGLVQVDSSNLASVLAQFS